MSDRDDNRTEHDPDRPKTLVVPGTARGEYEELGEDDLAEELQRAQDLGAASRSCVAIIGVLLIMALLICIFLVWALALR